MTEARNHHYVPQFILKAFCDDQKLYVFDKITGHSFRTSPRNVMSERDYNRVQLKDGCFIDFEQKYTFIEDKAAPAFSKIRKENDIQGLSPEHIASIACFLVIQQLRSRTSQKNFFGIGQHVRNNFPGITTNDFPEYFEESEYDKFCYHKTNISNIEQLVEPLLLKHMVLLVRRSGSPLYISDHPLVMHNSKSFAPYGNIGFGVPNIEIYFPLSPDIALALLCPLTIKSMFDEISSAEEKISLLKKSEYSSLDMTRALSPISDLATQVTTARLDTHLLCDKQVRFLDSTEVDFLNSLQLHWSARHIASRSDSFEFARKVLQERPHYRDHPRLQF